MTPHFLIQGKDFLFQILWFSKIEGKILPCPPYKREFPKDGKKIFQEFNSIQFKTYIYLKEGTPSLENLFWVQRRSIAG